MNFLFSSSKKINKQTNSVLVNTTIQRNETAQPVSFDPYGDRKNPLYELLNVRQATDGKKYTKQVGEMGGKSDNTATSTQSITVNLDDIIWPGNKTEAPTGVFISNHLRVCVVFRNKSLHGNLFDNIIFFKAYFFSKQFYAESFEFPLVDSFNFGQNITSTRTFNDSFELFPGI